MAEALEHLPGGDLVARGLVDLTDGRTDTVAALMVLQATRSLAGLGLAVPEVSLAGDPGSLLYQAAAREAPAAPHARYLALLEQLESFLHALRHQRRRQGAA